MTKLELNKLFPTFAAIYFITGLLFALFYAYFYHWPLLGFFSPGFYVVILTWPVQTIGFIPDILTFGLSGKPNF